MKETIISSEALGKPIIPDQVFTREELEWRELDEVMAGCPGYEYLDEPSSPNWPPKRGIIHSLKEFLSDVSFAVRYPHAHRAFKNLERENRRREFPNGPERS